MVKFACAKFQNEQNKIACCVDDFFSQVAVSCGEERQKASIVMSRSQRCGIKRRVFGVGFITRAMDCRPEISYQIMQYPLKICNKFLGGYWKEVLEHNSVPEKPESLG